MRKPANTRAMRLVSLALVVAMVMCGISGIFSVASAEGETFTLDQVAAMAKEVYEAGKEAKFAETATIGAVTMDQPTYFILACKALLTIDNGATIAFSGDKALANTKMNYRANPGNGDDSVASTVETFSKAQYIYCAERQVSYTQGKVVEGASGAPANYTTLPGSCPDASVTGKAGYERQLTVVLAALAAYADTKTLPATISATYVKGCEVIPADPNATPVPTAGPSLGEFEMSAVIDAAAALDLNAEITTVKVAGKEMNKPSFYNLMAQTVVNLAAGKTDKVTTLSLINPEAGAIDTFAKADGSAVTEIEKAVYVNRATRELGWTAEHPAPCNHSLYTNNADKDAVAGYEGKFSYERAFEVFVSVLASYKANNALPETVATSYTTPEATPAPTKVPEGTVKLNDVLAAAEAAALSFETNGTIPTTVKVGGKDYNGATFFRMMAHALYNTLGEGVEGDIPVYTMAEPDFSGDPLADVFKDKEAVSKGVYLYAAQRQLVYMDANGVPARVVGFPGQYQGDDVDEYSGQLVYQRNFLIFARALANYVMEGQLPATVNAKDEVNKLFTIEEVSAAAAEFLAAYNVDQSIAKTLKVAGVETNRGQYYKLFVEAIDAINNGNTTATFKLANNLVAPDGNGTDTFVVKANENDEIEKAAYLYAVQNGLAYVNDAANTSPSKYIVFSEETYPAGGYEGKFTYQNQLVVYARVLGEYTKTMALPEKVSAEFTLPTTLITAAPTAAPTTAAPTFIPGDATGDGRVNSRDIAAIQKHVAGTTTPLEGAKLAAADKTGDGKVNSLDIANLQINIAGSSGTLQVSGSNSITTAFAVTVDNAAPVVGDTITVTVAFTSCPANINTLELIVPIDTAAFEVVGTAPTYDLQKNAGSTGGSSFRAGGSEAFINFVDIAEALTASSTAVMTFQLKVKGSGTIAISEDDSFLVDTNTERYIGWTATAAKVTTFVPTPTPIPMGIINGMTYEKAASGYAITCYDGNEKEVVIPDEINGYPVTVIADSAFAECRLIERVVLPKEITTIEPYAFYCCAKLSDIVIPESVTSIGESAFENCQLSIIYGEKGSYAQTYAENNGMIFAPLPANGASVTDKGILYAAYGIYKSISNNSQLPKYVTMAGEKVYMNEALGIFALYVASMEKAAPSSIYRNDIALAGVSYENITGTSLTKDEYMSLAKALVNYMVDNESAPGYIETAAGALSFETLIKTFASIISTYRSTNELPASVEITAWSAVLPTPPADGSTSDSLSSAAVIDAASRISAVAATTTVPKYVLINNARLYRGMMLKMFAATVKNISDGRVGNITVDMISTPVKTAEETFVSGTLTKAEYLKLANRILNSIIAKDCIPTVCTTSLGTMNYLSMIKLYANILDHYNTNGTLPESISVG